MAKEENIKVLNDKLHINKIKLLIDVMYKNGKINNLSVNDFSLGDKIYNIEMNCINSKDRKLVINCSDGRELTLTLMFNSYENGDGYFDKWIEKVGSFRIIYNFNGEKLNINSNNLPYDYKYFKNISVDELININQSYYLLDDATSIRFVNSINKFDYKNHLLELYDDKINHIYNDRIIIFDYHNGEININNKKIPSYDETISFDLKCEKEKIKKMLERNSEHFHKFTRDYISSQINDLKEKEIYKNNIIEGYDALYVCKEMIEFYKRFLSNLENNVFSEDELLIIYNILMAKIINKEEEIKKDEALVKAKKLVKTLDPKVLEALRDEINKK